MSKRVSTLDALHGRSAVDMSSTKERPRSSGSGDVYPATNQSAGSQMPNCCRNATAPYGKMKDCTRSEVAADLEYGPGIVDKLRTRFIHLTLLDNDKPQLRRACSLENLVEDGLFQAIDYSKGDRSIVGRNRAKYDLSSCGKNNFKKAQSMETLVIKADRQKRNLDPRTILVNENVVIVEKVRDAPRSDVVEEYPKRDTVKTYKRMFEPAESKQVYRRKPPVLRASAKSSNKNCNSAVKTSAINEQNLAKEASRKPEQSGKQEQSVVFDFRGKSTKPHVTLQPTPFGCKPVQKSVRKFFRVFDGKEGLPNGSCWDDQDPDDELDEVDLPHPSGITFLGENVKIGRGSMLVNRNKNLKIQFNDKITSIHEYPSELSLLENNRTESEDETSNVGLSGLANYTPSVLKSTDTYHLGYPRTAQTEVPEKEVQEETKEIIEELKPADPESTSSWSSSTTTDLLF